MVVGHVYYFLEDILPNQPGGFRILKTPRILQMLCDVQEEDIAYEPLPDALRPGGYTWNRHDVRMLLIFFFTLIRVFKILFKVAPEGEQPNDEDQNGADDEARAPR